jgi:hypothetical protein
MPSKSRLTPHEPTGGRTADVEIAVCGICRRKRQVAVVPPAAANPAGERIPRISRLMALAIKFDEMIARGEARDYADLARLGYVTRARVTQIMNLRHLAPEIQETILFQQEPRAQQISERSLRTIVSVDSWPEQRFLWRRLSRSFGEDEKSLPPVGCLRRGRK